MEALAQNGCRGVSGPAPGGENSPSHPLGCAACVGPRLQEWNLLRPRVLARAEAANERPARIQTAVGRGRMESVAVTVANSAQGQRWVRSVGKPLKQQAAGAKVTHKNNASPGPGDIMHGTRSCVASTSATRSGSAFDCPSARKCSSLPSRLLPFKTFKQPFSTVHASMATAGTRREVGVQPVRVAVPVN